jgi:hypothetical protein
MNYIIVIPIYKKELSHNESISLRNILKHYQISEMCFVAPFGLEISEEYSRIPVENFDVNYFSSVKSYNRLMMSKAFYERFKNYKYMLLHQLDAYLFRDELENWCKKDYDYIGAPWLTSNNLFYKLFKSKKLKKRKPIFNKVGNGGFSLRKISTFLSFFTNNESVVKEYEDHDLYGIEDVFWSLIVPKYIDFNIPNTKLAAKFCLDRKPELGLKMNNGELPFGCHGFEKSKTKPFWKQYIDDLE